MLYTIIYTLYCIIFDNLYTIIVKLVLINMSYTFRMILNKEKKLDFCFFYVIIYLETIL